MENLMKISAKSRENVGKKEAKKLRRENMIPAVIYGMGKGAIPISIDRNDVTRILKSEMGENTILEITRDDIVLNAMLKEVQYDYLGDNIIHLDLFRIDINKPVKANIPIKTVGEAIGVRIEDGLIDFDTREVEVACLPKDILKEIEVDITELHSGQSIKIGTLDLGEKVTILTDPERVICSVTTKAAIVEEEVEEEIEEEEGEEAVDGEKAKPEDKEKAEDKGKAPDSVPEKKEGE
jgi:large subunit ribosomal protein L25